NTGQPAINSVVISDPLVGTLTRTSSSINGDQILDRGEIWVYTPTYTVPLSVMDNKGNPAGTNTLVNNVTVDGKHPNGSAVTQQSANASTPVTQSPSIKLVKKAVGTVPVVPGAFINYDLIVTNTGNVTLNNVVITDPNAVVTGGAIGTLAPGATVTITAKHALTKPDITARQVINQALADAKEPGGTDLTQKPSDDFDPLLTGAADPTVVPLVIPPYATNDSSLGNVQGATVTLNLLGNDQIATTDPALPAAVDVDLDPSTPGYDHVLVVNGKGTWTYIPATGIVSWAPVAGYTIDPAPIPYRLKELASTLTANATITVTYTIMPPDARNNASTGNTPGNNVTINILSDDLLADGTTATTVLTQIDLQPTSTGTVETTLVVAGQGTWTYNPATGQITFDPEQISYEDLLEIHFATHDPTTLNRQGADVGTQYRSEIFYTTEAQKASAENFIKLLTDQNIY
ncbi:MAG: DUF11 domain-containing protein, partial [Sphingobacteriales bacterium]